MRQLHKNILCYIAVSFIIFSCNQQPARQPGSCLTDTSLWADTANSAKTYHKIAQRGPEAIDTFYSALATSLIQQNKYELLNEHLGYYKKGRESHPFTKAMIARANGFACNYKAMYDAAHSCFEQAIVLDKAISNNHGLAESYLGMATNEVYWGNYEKSLDYHYLSLRLYEQFNDSANINRVQVEIAIDHYYQKEYDKSIAILGSCEQYYSRHGDMKMVATVHSILSSCFYNLDDFARSAAYARSSLDLRRKTGSPGDIAESLNNLSLSLMGQQQWAAASTYLQESLALMKQAGDQRQLPIIRQNLANCMWETGHVQQAEAELKAVIGEARQNGQKDALANVYKKLSALSKKQGKADSALFYYKQYKKWSDSLYNDEKSKAVSLLNIKYKTAKNEHMIQQLAAQRELESTQKIIYLLVSIFIAIVAASLILLLVSYNKKNKLVIEKVKAELAANEKELLFNKKELDTYTNSLLSKNKFIEELEARLNSPATQSASIEAPEQDIQISALYQLKILTEDDWTEFKMKFDKVYPGYINELRKQYPELTAGEQRQFLLIKLNIGTKECANMLGISIDSIKKNRYRLKKKFNLSEKETLDDFVRNFKSYDYCEQ